MSTLRINNIEAKSVPASPTIDEKVKITNSSGDVLVHIDGKTSGITTIGINTTSGNIKFDANSNIVVTGIITATKFVGTIEPTDLTVSGKVSVGGSVTAATFYGSGANLTSLPSQLTLSNNADNRVITGGSGTNLNGETYFTWNGNNLALRGGQNQNCTIELASDEGDSAADFWRVMAQNSDNALAIDHYATGSWVEQLRIGSNGYVNIGTGTAEEQLTIRNTSQHCLIRIISGNASGVSAGIDFGDADDSDVGRIRYYHDNNYMRFDTNASERMRIQSDGYMGLNTTGAQRLFSVKETNNKASLLIWRTSETNGDYSGIDFSGHPSNNGSNYQKGGIYWQTDGSGFGRGDMVFCNDGEANADNVAISDEKMRIHKEGHITKPYHVCFGATGNQGTYSVATGQVFAFNSYHQSYPNNRHTAYNTSTSKFTAPVAGVYSFTVNLYFRNVNLNNLFSLVPRINGSEVQGGAGDKMFFFSCQNINSETTISGTVYLNLGAGDEVDVARRTGQTGSHSFYMPHSSFFGHLIG